MATAPYWSVLETSEIFLINCKVSDPIQRSIGSVGSPRDQTRHVAALESGINIYHRHVGRAAIQHAKQRGNTAEACPITNTGRHGNDRTRDVTSDHAGQGSLHPCHNNSRIDLL